ncbi:MAG TPA: ABC transporter ATP-binding protein [Candidatus Limnocylindria bacterium]|nr:ABC transporter ATP-binding protein [Candidatus Limnocylindria bacterium]
MLSIQDLKVSYGAIEALRGVTLRVGEGSIVAILGANGAGKSTLLKTISGLVKPRSGSIILEGRQDIAGMYPYKIAGMGVIQSPEGRLILQGLTTEENLMVGAYGLDAGRADLKGAGLSKRALVQKNFEEVYGLFPILRERRRQQANTLSGGEQQMLAIGRALMASPRVLLLDEPSLGLAPLIIRDIFRVIQQLRERGNTILIVEQNAFQTLKIADYAYVLELGRVSMQGPANELIRNEDLVEAYLGGQKA